ncbi:MAG TPA: S-layer homology domain-containing protein [Thermoanaerobaculia bacterium]|nr:S-layer homology domain-containing protein [Thermoanaerobaculia bacterium]
MALWLVAPWLLLPAGPLLAIWPPEAAAVLEVEMAPRLEAGLPGQLFPPTNWWNTEVSAAPVDSNSDAYLTYVNGGGVAHLHPDFGGNASGNKIYGFPYAVVDGAQAKLAVQFDQADESDGVTHPADVSFPFYPVPNEAISQPHWVEGGNPGNIDDTGTQDRHLLVVDRDNRFLYELYNVWYDGAGWEGYSGAFFDLASNDRRPDGWTSADAAGLAILPGLVRWDEVYGAGEIHHAFRFTVRHTKGYVYPASHLAGTQVDGALPMGARLRLKASKDISGFDPWVQKIFRAMKTYGLIVADNGTDMYISGTWDTRWDNDILNPAFDALTASDFEVVQTGWSPPLAPALSVDGHPGGASDENGVLEPGETAVVSPSWQSPSGGVPLTGAIAAFWGPPGATYAVAHGSASYGAPAADTPSDCWAASADCFRLSVSAPATRPAAHWDAYAQEVVNGEASKTWTLHVGGSFSDAPAAHPFYPWIETVFHLGVTAGCGDATYCPDAAVTRAQMAVFLLKSKMSAGYAPPAASGTVFADVPAGAFAGAWIEDLAGSGVTSGCGGSFYCPGAAVTRAQMAVFLLKTRYGSAYAPPAASGVFADVPASDPYAPWIEELAAEGVTAGCGGGDYCPTTPITRGQMAVFLSRMFGMTLYGP